MQLHGNESYAFHAIAQLLTGINGVMEFVTLGSSVPYEEPFVANASPIIKNLVAFHHEGAVGQNSRYCGLKNFCEAFFAQHLDRHTPPGCSDANMFCKTVMSSWRSSK